MDRRAALKILLRAREAEQAPRAFTPPSSGLSVYAGPWGFEQAAHLLRRGMFGPGYEHIHWAMEHGLEATVDQLLEDLPLPDPPLNSNNPDDPSAPLGATWVNAPFLSSHLSSQWSQRWFSLRAWTLGVLRSEGISIRERMTLFWHNHFPMEGILDPKYIYRYITLLRSHALGNFRQLVKDVTVDPAMLRYLDGRFNIRQAPNENYARELLELFTVGKGPQIEPGDYSNYTEQDILEISRILTGWRDYGFTVDNESDGDFGAAFFPVNHDEGVKTLSHHFGNAQITNMGDQEYAHVIDIIFQQPEVARFISRKIYRWLVYYQIDDTVEANVIEPMAQILLDNDFEVRPALRALLSSEHFFDVRFHGVMIKNPADYVVSVLKSLEVETSQPLDQMYDSWYSLFRYLTFMQMEYYFIPEVAGWSAYYREPLYYRNWISASTFPPRMELVEKLSTTGLSPYLGNGQSMRVDVLGFAATLDDPADPALLVEGFARLLLPRPLTAGQLEALKEVLLDGLPDFEWTVEYSQYLAEPDNSGLANSLENRLRALLAAVLTMPEFNLM